MPGTWTRLVRRTGGRLAAALALAAFANTAPAQPDSSEDLLDRTFAFNVEAQPVSAAIIELSKQANVQVAIAGSGLDEHYTQGIRGTFSVREALERLLVSTGYEFQQTGATTIAVQASAAQRADTAERVRSAEPFHDTAPAAELPKNQAQVLAPEREVIAAESTAPKESLPAVPVQSAEDSALGPSAHDPGASVLDTIVVTASKRAQLINEYAGTVNAISGEKLEKIGAQSFSDYLKLVPGVTMQEFVADGSAPVIRGIATQTGPYGIGARTTGIFVDEIPLADLFLTRAIIDLNPFDLERVEVMKGPQGTLFGSSSIAGAIRYITHKPELNLWQAKAFGTYTDINEGGDGAIGAGMVNIPLGRTAAVRAVGLRRRSPGFIDDLRLDLRDVGQVEQTGERVIGRWMPGDRLHLTATWLRQTSEQVGFGFADQDERLERESANAVSSRISQVAIANLVGTYAFDWGTLLSNSSRITKDNTHNNGGNDRTTGVPDGSGTDGTGLEDQPFPLIGVGHFRGTLDGYTQELRLSSPEGGRWQWQAGVAWLRFDEIETNVAVTPFVSATADMIPPVMFALPLFPLGTPFGSIAGREDLDLTYAVYDARATESAAFGELTVRLWERWEATLGGRLFRTELVADTLSRGLAQSALTPGEVSDEGHDEIRERGFNPKASLRYLMNQHVNLYALAARGFQFGGIQLFPYNLAFNAIAEGQAGPKFVPFKSSTLWNYEVGARTEWFDRRLQFDATLFHLIWKDLQLLETVAFQGMGVFALYGNIGKATSSGVEAALRVVPARGLSFTSSAAWTKAVTAVRVANSSLDLPEGTQMPGAARFQIANTIAYERPFSLLGSWNAGLSLTHSYVGRIFTDLQHTASFGEYSMLDAGAHLINGDFAWQPELTLGVSNLLDTRAIAGIATCAGCRFEDTYFVRPRTVTASLQLRF